MSGKDRLQKVMAHAGVASRRACEEYIRAGRVTVNDKVAELGCKVDPTQDDIRFDGQPIGASERHVYIMLNKPEGYITTVSDPHGRPTVMDLVDNVSQRIYPVGRLDYDSSGLVLMTNDGELAHRLLHPRYESDKTYIVTVQGRIRRKALNALRRGVTLDDGPTAPAQVIVLNQRTDQSTLRMTIHEGRNRQIRRMMQAVGHPVRELTRVAVGPLKLGKLLPGSWRHLNLPEVARLRHYVR